MPAWRGGGWCRSVLVVSIRVSFGPVQSWVLPSDLSAASQARRHIEAACAGVPEETLYTARLLVTELVSNAVLHGRGTVLLSVACGRGGVRVEVHDESPSPPIIVDGPPLSEHGAGLRLVSALADNWGSGPPSHGRPGKRVWFTLP